MIQGERYSKKGEPFGARGVKKGINEKSDAIRKGGGEPCKRAREACIEDGPQGIRAREERRSDFIQGGSG